MDVDTLVRHDLPVVMVMGNNSAWGLEKGPMQMLYGYDVIADLAPRTPYDEVVQALGGGGETVTDPKRDRPGPRPRLRQRRALPRQRDHRRGGGLPAGHLRHLSARCIRRARPRTRRGRRADASRRTSRLARQRRGDRTSSSCATPRPATARPSCWVAVDAGRPRGARHGDALPARARRGARSGAPTRASSGCSRSHPQARGPGRRRGARAARARPVPRGRAPSRWCSRASPEMAAAHRIYERLGFGRCPERDWGRYPASS